MKNKIIVNIKRMMAVGTIILALVLLPFIIENILIDTKYTSFNFTMDFSKEIWFGFIASYLGAVGTVLLGIIALYQNKKYKALSDNSEKRFLELQAEIKELNKKNVDLIEINTKIEKAKYYPMLSELKHYYWNMGGNSLKQDFDMDNPFQITIKKEDSFEDRDGPIDRIFDEYYTFTYVLKNEGEKTIRNFSCCNVNINDRHGMGFWIYYPCDIEPGKVVYVVYATKVNLSEKIKTGEIYTLDFRYKMENVIGETFCMNIHTRFYHTDKNVASTVMELSGVIREDE